MYQVKEIGYQEWSEHFIHCNKSNLMQSWQYGEAKQQSSMWRVIRFLVSDENDEPLALAQYIQFSILKIGGLARMNRGPVLLGEKENSDKVILDVIASLMYESKKRRWWMVQIAPELLDNHETAKSLSLFGLKHVVTVHYASGLLSLHKSKNELLSDLKGKWRNRLRKGIKLGITVTTKHVGSDKFESLWNIYRLFQSDKGFRGLSRNLLSSLIKQRGNGWSVDLFVANIQEDSGSNNDLGMVITIQHGDTTTYLIGATTNAGRDLQANYVFLWDAILHAKNNGSRWFDIGGLNSTTTKGIAHFKRGINSDLYTLIGEWRGIITPW